MDMKFFEKSGPKQKKQSMFLVRLDGLYGFLVIISQYSLEIASRGILQIFKNTDPVSVRYG